MSEGEDQEQPLRAPCEYLEQMKSLKNFLFDNELGRQVGRLPFKFKHNMLFALFQFHDLTPFTDLMRNKLMRLEDGVQKAGPSMRYFDLTEDALEFVDSIPSKNETQFMDNVKIYCKYVVQMVEDILGAGWNLDVGITGQKPSTRLRSKLPSGCEGNAFLMYKFELEICKTFEMTPRQLAERVEERMQNWLKLRAKSIHGKYNPGGKVAEASATTYVYVHFYRGNGAVPT